MEMSREEYERRRSEDFKFMVLCAAKHNMSMYHLLKDQDLADARIVEAQEIQLAEGG